MCGRRRRWLHLISFILQLFCHLSCAFVCAIRSCVLCDRKAAETHRIGAYQHLNANDCDWRRRIHRDEKRPIGRSQRTWAIEACAKFDPARLST
jgi:hypothetical protein